MTRWQPDPTEDRLGYLSSSCATSAPANWWSATAEPKSATDERAQTLFSDDKASFVKSVGDAAHGGGMHRRLRRTTARAGAITLYNDGAADRHHRSHLLCRTGARLRGIGQRASGLLEDVRGNGNRPPNNGAIFATSAQARYRTSRTSPWCISSPIRQDRRATPRPKPTDAHSSAVAVASPRRRPSIPAPRLGGNSGFTLDPVASLRRGRCACLPTRRSSLTFWTVVGSDRAETG